MKKHSWLVGIEDYAPLIRDCTAERILLKATIPWPEPTE
jgi:hypothetical protein